MVLLAALAASAADRPPAPPLRLSSPTLTVGVVPGLGARIVELRAAGGENLLDADPRFWAEPFAAADLRTPFAPWNGHTYWVGPQSAWWTQQDLDPERRSAKANWPPDPFHETARYEVRERTPFRVRLEGPPSPITGLRRQLEVELAAPRRVRLRVTATNVRTSAVAWSFYSNTRVRPDGWAYVRLAPDGVQRIDSPPHGPYPHRLARGFFVSPPGGKPGPGGAPRTADVFLRPTEGQIAYFRSHQLLLKRTETFPEARLHPEETFVELYRSSGGRGQAELLELELHGPYQTLAPGQTMSFDETWEVLDYPGPARPGAHLDFLEALVKRAAAGRSRPRPGWCPLRAPSCPSGSASRARSAGPGPPGSAETPGGR
jgi:uncharacterized protein DUF4380